MTVQSLGKSPEQFLNPVRCNSNRLLRLPQIIGQREVTFEQAEANRKSGRTPKTPRPYIEPVIPISPAAWWLGVKEGKYPQPIKLGSRTTVWRESEILNLINPA